MIKQIKKPGILNGNGLIVLVIDAVSILQFRVRRPWLLLPSDGLKMRARLFCRDVQTDLLNVTQKLPRWVVRRRLRREMARNINEADVLIATPRRHWQSWEGSISTAATVQARDQEAGPIGKPEFVDGWSGAPGRWEMPREGLTDWLVVLLLRLHFALSRGR